MQLRLNAPSDVSLEKPESHLWEDADAALAESGGDEQYALFPELHRFVVPDGHHWHCVVDLIENIGSR